MNVTRKSINDFGSTNNVYIYMNKHLCDIDYYLGTALHEYSYDIDYFPELNGTKFIPIENHDDNKQLCIPSCLSSVVVDCNCCNAISSVVRVSWTTFSSSDAVTQKLAVSS